MYNETFAGLSTKGLEATISILSNRPPRRCATKAEALRRIEGLLRADSDPETSGKNLPDILRSRGFEADAGILEAALGPQECTEPEAPDKDPEAKVRAAKAELGRLLATVAKAKETLREAEAALRKVNGGKRPSKSSASRASGAMDRLLKMFQRPEGVRQDEVTREFNPKWSAAHRGKKLAAKLGVGLMVEGEGKARVFRLPAA